MKITYFNILRFLVVFASILSATSCDKNSDLVTEYVLSDNLQKEQLDGFVADEFSKTNPE